MADVRTRGSNMKSTNKDLPPKLTPTQMKKKIQCLEETVQKLEDSAWCYLCDTIKSKDKFYVSTDPNAQSGLTPICKDCARKIACRVDENGEEHEPTIDSVKEALRYLDKPFIESLWNASVEEAQRISKEKENYTPWSSYTKNVALVNYKGMTFADSDMFKHKIIYEDEMTPEDLVEGRENQDTYSDFVKNKKDVIRLLSYDPFEKESISDQPFLYSQLLGLLDSSEDANDDMMRTASAISIVRGFLQQSKIDDIIAKFMSNSAVLQQKSPAIKSLMASKKDITSVIKDLAAESCISLKNTKNAKKGENTWTGKLKKIKDLNLREGEVNGFDLETCKGMQQVMDLSNASILKQLRLDESEWSDMVAEQREKLVALQDELANYKEVSRILLRENIDLKDLIKDKGISIDEDLVDLNSLFACFSELEETDEEEVDENDQS